MTLSIKNISKSYGRDGAKALSSFSIDLTEGVYALLGPNGAGKSTLMNIIAGNLRTDSGNVFWNGQNIQVLGKEYLSILGYMPQQQNVYPDFTASRFLWYMAALKGLTRKQAKVKIEELLHLLHLEDSAHKKLGAFSGGMRQRILIAQALLNDPKILILDEPTAGLDPMERVSLRNLISEISLSKIVIFATHVVSDVEHIAKEIFFLKKGHVLLQDTPANIMKTMSAKCWQVVITVDELAHLQQNYVICSIAVQNDGRLLVTFMSEASAMGFDCTATLPALEGVYLYLFNGA